VRRVPLASLEVSVIGLGCNNFGRALDAAGSKVVVDAALDAGMNFFDSSDNYGEAQSEGFLGAALGSRRSEVVIATKFGMPVSGVDGSGGAKPDYIRRAVRRSLDQLGTDYIDMYQLHKPDPTTPIGDTLEVMWELVEQGLVREIGCSNLDTDQLGEALEYSAAKNGRVFVSNQIEYSLVNRSIETNGLADLCRANDVALLPFYPLASGLLTGKTRRGQTPVGRLTMDRYQNFLTERNFDIAEAVEAFAGERGITMVQVALGWLIAQPGVPSVTAGATRVEQVGGNAAAAEWIPTTEDLEILDAISAP
jgi:aryl-alcohol dehydrogenase-like predicted oxidoreductase